MNKILKKVIKKVKPSRSEVKKVKNVKKDVINKLTKQAESMNVKVEVVLGGSASRGTFMKGDYDLDFFIRFRDEGSIKKYYKKIVKPLFKNVRIVHGTRDYYKFEYKGFDIEIVPSIKFEKPSEAENSADISYFHINYLKKKFEKNPGLRKEVLVLKQFLKANNVYGAESARSGFSGYVTELLIIHFKTFKKLLNFFENAKPKIVIDIENHYNSDEEVLESLNKNKIKSPLIIVDPLLKDRNASASLNYATFSQFLFRVRYLNRKPMLKLFNIRGLKKGLVKERSKRRGTKLIMYSVKDRDDESFDITKAKLLKKMKRLVKDLEKEGWSIYNYGVTDDGKLFFEFETLKVSKAKRHYGPLVWSESEHFTKFFNKWKSNELGKPYVYNKRLVVDVYRKRDLEQEIQDYLKDYIC